jgi:hypothetical protein
MTKQEKEPDAQQQRPLTVYQAIAKVQASLAKEGIAKDRTSGKEGDSGPKFKFRGIDDVYNTISGLLAETGLCILPRLITRETSERKKPDGKMLYFVAVEVEYDLVSAHDSSKHTIRVPGEAMDSGDKATNKAMSAAYKYACLQTFCIPTEGDNDADASSHEVAAKDALFPNPDVRSAFTANCIDAIAKSENITDLRTQKECNLAKWNAMKTSPDPADVEAYNAIINAYNAKFVIYRDEAQKAAAQKPATVEAAKKQPVASPLGDDEIPF